MAGFQFKKFHSKNVSVISEQLVRWLSGVPEEQVWGDRGCEWKEVCPCWQQVFLSVCEWASLSSEVWMGEKQYLWGVTEYAHSGVCIGEYA